MTDAEKLSAIKIILEGGGEIPSDEKLSLYISLSGSEILNWMYHLVGGVPDGENEVPTKYENTQIYAVVAGYTHAGAEGESVHIENSVHRHFLYEDMLGYIHDHVLPYVRVGAVNANSTEE